MKPITKIKTLGDKEKELLQMVLTKTDGNLEKASHLLRIPISELRRKIREHGLHQNPTI